MNASNALEFVEMLKRVSPIILDLFSAQTDEEFDKAFDKLLEKALNDLEKDKVRFSDLSEDALSSIITTAIGMTGITATREENSNGHVDLTFKLEYSTPVRTKLGEAKIWDGAEYHIKGLDQLMSRYLTSRELRGFVISYVKTKDIKTLFGKLRKKIDDSQPCSLVGLCKDHGIKWSFLSSHKHDSGENVDVCHLGCNLYCSKINSSRSSDL